MQIKNKKRQQVTADLALLGVSFIWGATFVVVKNALSSIGPFYFLAIRFMLAFLFLLPIYRQSLTNINRPHLSAGCLIGTFLFGGYAFQTVGLQYTTASNAGFITGLSVVLVPALHAFLNKKVPGFFTTAGIMLSVLGLGLLSLERSWHFNPGDVLVLLCALCFALHIITVGYFAPSFYPPLLAIIQIGTVSLVSFLFGVLTETWPRYLTSPVWIALLLTAIPATALAFLIQNSVQRYTSATHTAIIFTTEPVFAAICAYLWSGEVLSLRQLVGCALILAGMLIAELRGEDRRCESGRGYNGRRTAYQ